MAYAVNMAARKSPSITWSGCRRCPSLAQGQSAAHRRKSPIASIVAGWPLPPSGLNRSGDGSKQHQNDVADDQTS